MDTFLTYEEFNSIIGEALMVTANEFNQLNDEASSLLNYSTFNRIETSTNLIKRTVCDLILFIRDQAEVRKNNGKYKSESVDEYSITYVVLSEDQLNDQYDKGTQRIIKRRLGHTGLLYRGMGGTYVY